jgi:nitroreductase
MLGAVERGLGGCILTSVDRDSLRSAFAIPYSLDILLIIALGTPVEQVVLEALSTEGNIKYYRSADGVHHVPKRSIDDLVFIPANKGDNPA